MEKQILIGEVDSLIASCLEQIQPAVDSIEEAGYLSSHVDSQFVDRLGSDVEALRKAYKHYCSRPDTLIITELYNLICSIHDRIQLKWQHIVTTNGSDDPEDSMKGLSSLLECLRALRSRFLYDVRGRDIASTPKDPDGKSVRTNRHVKLGQQRVLERGRIMELD